MVDTYVALRCPARAEIEIRRSRFLCTLAPVTDEAQARAFIDEIRGHHWDARHHCSAFVLGPTRAVRRSNDDGEPSGTAGMPMLDVLLGAGVSDVVAVVTRWFGGTLLGTGGLVKAYGQAVTAALDVAHLVTMERRVVLTAQVPIADVGRLENMLRAAGLAVDDVDYETHARSGQASLRITAPAGDVARAEALLGEARGGSSRFDVGGEVWGTRG